MATLTGMRALGIALLAAAACSAETVTDVCLDIDPAFTAAQSADVRAGVEQWAELGFAFDVTCARTVTIAQAEIPNGGKRRGDLILIQQGQEGGLLRLIAAHEAGHALLDSGDHIEEPGHVMSPTNEGTVGWQLTDADRAWAIERWR